jgi:hypothetical protein
MCRWQILKNLNLINVSQERPKQIRVITCNLLNENGFEIESKFILFQLCQAVERMNKPKNFQVEDETVVN